MKITTNNLIDDVQAIHSLTKPAATAIVEGLFEKIREYVAEGHTVQIKHFAKIEKKEVARRMGRNPKTGEEIEIPAHNRPKFTALKGLKDAVN